MASEDGEIEDGELQEEEGQLQEAESGEASGYEEGEEAGEVLNHAPKWSPQSISRPQTDIRPPASSTGQPPPMSPPAGTRAARMSLPGGPSVSAHVADTGATAAEPVNSSRSSGRAGQAANSDAGVAGMACSRPAPGSASMDAPPATEVPLTKEERERAELLSCLSELTRSCSFQDCVRNVEAVCRDLKTAIKKLDKLLRKAKKRKDGYGACMSMSQRIMDGLQAVAQFASTSQFQTEHMEPAKALFKAAMNYRHDIFSTDLKQELEALVRNSRAFKCIWEERQQQQQQQQQQVPSKPAQAVLAPSRAIPVPATEDDPDASGDPSESKAREVDSKPRGRSGSTSVKQEADAAGALPQVTATAAASDSQHELTDSPPPPATAASKEPTSRPAATASRSSRHTSQSSRLKIVVSSVPGAIDQANDVAADKDASAAGTATRASASAGGNKEAALAGSASGHKRSVNDVHTDSPGKPSEGRNSKKHKNASVSSQEAVVVKSEPATVARVPEKDLQDATMQLPDLPVSPRLEVKPDVKAAAAAKGIRSASPGGAGSEDVALLLGRGCACAVVDLERVLFCLASPAELDPQLDAQLRARVVQFCTQESASLPDSQRELHLLSAQQLWAKLRPGAAAFLRRLTSNFELWAYTRYDRQLADALLDIIDPRQQLFGPRIIAAADEGILARRLAQSLEGRRPLAVLLTDANTSSQGPALPLEPRSILHVEPYPFFPRTHVSSRQPGRSLLHLHRDECQDRGVLGCTAQLLGRIHTLIFQVIGKAQDGGLNHMKTGAADALAPWDIRSILEQERGRVLAGLHLVFSRVAPRGSDVRQLPLWRLAQQFGANCSEDPSDATTHVVTTDGSTDKALWARQRGRFVVSAAWLDCCCALWRKVDEGMFQLPLVADPLGATLEVDGAGI